MKNSFMLILVLIPLYAFSQTAQWRGENRDGHYNDTGLLKSWPENGPPLLFKTDSIGAGYSSAVEYKGIIYVTGTRNKEDMLSALDPDGKITWQVPYGKSWGGSTPDVRSTPTILDNRVYLISGSGDVVCLDATSGKIIWSVPAFQKFGGLTATWGTAESPLLVGNKVIYTPGGWQTMMIALDKDNGETVWQTESLNDSSAYVSPILFEYGGKKIIAQVSSNYIFGVDAADGAILWKTRYHDINTPTWHPNAPVINCISPIYHDGQIYVTSGYNHVGVKFSLPEQGSDMKILWIDTTLDTHTGGVVLLDGYLYGSNWINNGQGNWCCIDWESGKTMYETEWNCKGSIITADIMLYVYDERRGNVGLVENNHNEFRVVSSFRVTDGYGPCWAHPTIFNKKLLVRHGEVLLVYDIEDNNTLPERQWSMFRGYYARGWLDDAGIPGTWSVEKNENILWKADIPGLGLSSPVIWGDRLFITTAVSAKDKQGIKTGIYGNVGSVDDESVHDWIVYCYNKNTGQVLWERTACSGIPKVKRHPKSTHANTTIATDGSYIVAFFGSEGLYGYDINGNLKWKKDLGLLQSAFFIMKNAEWEFASSPLIHDGKVIIQCDVMEDSFLAAFDLATGEQIWKTARDEYPGWCTPNIYYDSEKCRIAVNGYKHRGGYDFMTGEEVWSMSGGGDIPIPTPVVSGGLVYFNSAHGASSPILAVKTSAMGEIPIDMGEVTNEYVVWSKPRGGSYMQTMLVYRGLLYNAGWNGSVDCFDAETGQEVWSHKAGSGNSYISSPVASDGRIYICDDEGMVYVIEAGREYKLLAEIPLGDICMATPAITDHAIYFRTMKQLIVIGRK